MDRVNGRAIRYLALDQLAADPMVARRLPADLARRFHALALAEDRDRITVAMADPDDRQAREAIAAALGADACVVQGDAALIDALLTQIWGDEDHPPLLLALHSSPGAPAAGETARYAQSLADLLGARLCRFPDVSEADWVLVGQADGPDRGDRFVEQGERSDQRRLAASARLLIRQPRWPLTRILLALSGTDRDSEAVDWAQRLGRASRCRVTVLAIAPSAPALPYEQAEDAAGLSSLLATGSALGQRLRLAAYRLTAWGIDCTLRLRQGIPALQIDREARAGDFDLVVVGDPLSFRRSLSGADGPEDDLLDLIDRSVLIAAPLPA